MHRDQRHTQYLGITKHDGFEAKMKPLPEGTKGRVDKVYTYLLHHAPGFELVAVGQAANEDSLALPIDAQPARLAFRPAKCLRLHLRAFNIILGATSPLSLALLLLLLLLSTLMRLSLVLRTRTPVASLLCLAV